MECKTIYYNDDPHFSLDELQAIIEHAWIIPDVGYYIDDQGSATKLPPFDVRIIITPLSKVLKVQEALCER